MKWLLLSLFVITAASTEAQVFFGTVPQEKINDWRVTPITFSLDKPNMNRVINGRELPSLVSDVNEKRNHEKVYNYSELSAKIYPPASTYVPAAARVQYFLLMPMPAIKMPEKGRRNTGC